jgi:hypothetical protein
MRPNLMSITGGAALTPYLPASRKLRVYFTGIDTNFISEIYDQTDLLEPIARSSFTDINWPSGQSGIGFLNATLEPYAADDITYDNYFSTGSTNTGVLTSTPFIGFPGTPQVINLKPKAQTLFYQPQANSNITFNVTTFTTNQISTNTLKMFLNGIDVTAQLTFSPVGLPFPLGSPNTNFFVRYTGTLAPNTIYYGQIRVLDLSGKGTTNNWTFDTFNPSGTVTIEAEDYNYNGGQFQDNPPVSGLDPDGNQVNGGGLGYFDLQGYPCIDFNDLDHRTINVLERNQYRTQDKIGTGRSRTISSDTLRPQYAAANLTDYVVLYVQSGEWMNYTRTFPANNYNVYLRASSQKAQAVRLDEITSGSSTYLQTKTIRGEFLVPNTGGSTRYRYTPLTDGAGNLLTLNLSGVKTFRLTMLEASQINALEVGDIQINYLLFVPTSRRLLRACPGWLSPRRAKGRKWANLI